MAFLGWSAFLSLYSSVSQLPATLAIGLAGEDCGRPLSEVRSETARTERERRKGLGGRASLEEGAGMLFVFERPGPISFWMKDVSFPLTALFFDSRGMLLSAVDMAVEADPAHPGRSYPEPGAVSAVLEIEGGSAWRWRPGETFLCVETVINPPAS